MSNHHDRAAKADDAQCSVEPLLATASSHPIRSEQLFIHPRHLAGQSARLPQLPLSQTASVCQMKRRTILDNSRQDSILSPDESNQTPPGRLHHSRCHSKLNYIVADSVGCGRQHQYRQVQHNYQKTGRRRSRGAGGEGGGGDERSESARRHRRAQQAITSAAADGCKKGQRFKSSYMQLLAITLALLSLLSQLKSVIGQQQQQLPTVIVRGFLNYRTTVDGTVLLFTPDAGQHQQQPASSTIQSSSSPPPAYLDASTSASGELATATYFTAPPKSNIIPSSTAGAMFGAIEPTSVLVTPGVSSLSTSQVASSHASGGGGHYEQQSPIAQATADTAQADQWHPIQATPPLRSASPRGSSSVVEDGTGSSATESGSRPVVQADDLVTAGGGAERVGGPQGHEPQTSPKPVAAKSDSGRSGAPAGKPKRPPLSFGSQGSRSGSALQSRFRPTSDGSSSNSINGIRRPGLSGGQQQAASTTSAPSVQSSSEPSAQAANAFQSRLASANIRMRNRLKHKHHLFGNSSAPSGGHNNGGSSPQASALGSSGRSDGSLDVASSIEQPTSAASTDQAAQPLPAAASGGEHSALWSPLQASSSSSSSPAVGSDEIMLSMANNGDQADTAPDTPRSGPDGEPAAGPTVSSKVESEPGLEPLSPEQEAGLRPLSRSGELRPSSMGAHSGDEQPKLLRGGLQQGALSSGPLNLDVLFQSDQPDVSSSANSGQQTDSSDHSASHVAGHAAQPDSKPTGAGLTRPNGSALGKPRPMSHNDKLNGWLGTHHNKFVPRPAPKHHGEGTGANQQLAANLNHLSPSFSVPHIHPTTMGVGSTSSAIASATPTLIPATVVATMGESAPAGNWSSDNGTAALSQAGSTPIPVAHPDSLADGTELSGPAPPMSANSNNVSMQTITRTYSTVLTTSKTRLVPLQVKSSTAVYTITEDYVMTKMMTAYQTMPAGEFILPEPASVSAFDVFADAKQASAETAKLEQQQAVAGSGASGAPIESQEQPISLDTSSAASSSKSAANNWLHDFTNPGQDTGASQLTLGEADPFQQSSQQQQQQQAAMLALLEQQARDANLAGGFPAPGETLDQLASQLDPAALLADGAINIPDLNNPLVLAAAIQNPQLAAVILAAQQLKLKQRQNKFIQQQQQQQQPQQQFNLQQPQVSYSTSYSTTIRPSTYTARDTMYTTRLVSFRDGRTVRTRTVSEPGSVIEQVLTTVVTERVPVTITIKPTGVLAPLPGPTVAPSLAGAASATGAQLASNNQATINNALFASQLASILARRQHQLQTSFSNPALMGLAGTGSGQAGQAAATPQQLQAIQQLFNQQKRQQSQQLQHQQHQAQQQAQGSAPLAANQFQPNLQQLLQNMQQQQSPAQASSSSSGGPNTSSSPQSASSGQQVSHSSSGGANQNGDGSSRQQQEGGAQSGPNNREQQSGALGSSQFQATPSLPAVPKSIDGAPITTTLTSLQVRTYTVHNAFKTIFRTITSTVLIPTVLASG